RDKSKRAPHNLYGHGQDLLTKGGQPVPVRPLFSYLDASATFNGDPVASIDVGFKQGYGVTYTFDAASHTWKRSYGLAPHTADSGQQIAPTNVIVQFVGCCVPSPEGGAYQTVGQGQAWVLSDGKIVRGQWTRSDRSQPTQYVDASGAPIKLQPGRTWVEYVPASPDYPVNVTAAPPSAPAPSTPPPPAVSARRAGARFPTPTDRRAGSTTLMLDAPHQHRHRHSVANAVAGVRPRPSTSVGGFSFSGNQEQGRQPCRTRSGSS